MTSRLIESHPVSKNSYCSSEILGNFRITYEKLENTSSILGFASQTAETSIIFRSSQLKTSCTFSDKLRMNSF